MLRGTVVGTGDVRTVSTRYGDRALAEVTLDVDAGETTVTLWGDWAETAELVAPGVTLAVTDPAETEYRGRAGYATTGDSLVVVEPGHLVDVTAVRDWVQCPRLSYLNGLSGVPLAYPVVKGTIVHEVFGDLLRGRDVAAAVDDRVAAAGLELGLLDRDADATRDDVRSHARAIEAWLEQGTLTERDEWRSEYALLSPRYGLKGRCDAVRRGMPVELKTGKNTRREPRFEDKVQAACYALILREHGRSDADTGTLLYTKNATLDRGEGGDLSPAKEFSIGDGLLAFVLRARNGLVAARLAVDPPTGHEGDAICEYCFEQDTCLAVSGRLDQESKAGRIGSPVPAADRAYFDRQYRLLEAERRAVHREYARLWRESPEERAAADRALLDLEPIGRRQLDDGRWELRARGTGAASKIREGDVVLASEGRPVGGEAERARVARLDDEVVVTADEPIDLRRLDVSPSEFGVDRGIQAVAEFVLKGDERTRDVLLGRDDPVFGAAQSGCVDGNPAQDRAVGRAVAAGDFALIHGPPGTGKTYTIARLIRALVDDGDRVLLAAYTNRAVDTAVTALRDQGFEDVVRMGTERGVSPDVADRRLDPRGEPADRAATLRDAPVVAATTTTCGSRELGTQSFDVAVIDEASQLTEPDTLAAVNRADRFVLVGDHRQLPPVVRAENALTTSLFERLVDEHPDAAVRLDRQYRMAQAIQAFPSAEFYDGGLRPASGDVAARRIDDIADPAALPDELRTPVTFLPVEGDAGRHTDEGEADRAADAVRAFVDAGVPPGDIGVIAPFRAQVATIAPRVPDGVTVDTVDRFQGSAREVVVLSFAATGGLDGPIFEDDRRLNVALTRAKRALVLVGDPAALRSRPVYARMLDWADRVP